VACKQLVMVFPRNAGHDDIALACDVYVLRFLACHVCD